MGDEPIKTVVQAVPTPANPAHEHAPEITAKAVIIIGHVTGNVSATERIEVQSSGLVDGDVRAPKLVVQEGAVLNGAVEMGAVKASGAKPDARSPQPGAGTAAPPPGN